MPSVIAMRNGLKDDDLPKISEQAQPRDSKFSQRRRAKAGMKITKFELAALFIVTGQGSNLSSTKSMTNAYGFSLLLAQSKDGKSQVTFRRSRRNVSQRFARGYAISPLFAKHLAMGSLPYQQGTGVVESILIDHATLDSIQVGASLYLKPSPARTTQARYLSSLPNSRLCIFNILATATEPHSPSVLTDAIAVLPFSSGLVPLVSAPLVRTVQLIASGGLPHGRLLQRLEGLVDKVHRFSPHLNIFGPLYEPHNAGLLYRERERLGKLATNSQTLDTLTDKTARISRYTVLLSRLMALIPDMKPHEVLDVVQEATKKEMQNAYINAMAAHANVAPSKSSSPINWRDSVGSETNSKRNSVTSAHRSSRTNSSSSSPRRSAELGMSLAKQVEAMLKTDLPFSIQTVALVARMVIVAWTLSVECVAWENGEEGLRLPSLENLPEESILC